MDYQLVRSKRRTIAIHITQEAQVEVRAPYHVSRTLIDDFVRSKTAWITAKRKMMQERMQPRIDLREGSTLPILGQDVVLHYMEESSISLVDQKLLLPKVLADQPQKALTAFFRETMRMLITARAKWYAAQMGVTYTALRINSASTRWGSCSGKNSLNFSWRLIFADLPEIDYVVVHELAHLKHHDHSPEFWRIVEGILPDYKSRRQALADLAKSSTALFWDK